MRRRDRRPRTGENTETYEENINLTARGNAGNPELVSELTGESGPLNALGHPAGGMLVHKPLPAWAQPDSAPGQVARL